METVFELTARLHKVSRFEQLTLGYYFFREGIELGRLIAILGREFAIPAWFTETSLKKIIKTVTEEKGVRSVGYTDSSFTSTYYSACVVRHAEEIERNAMIADNILLLAIVDKQLMETSNAISLRLSNSDLIRYDASLEGGPLLSKSERTLLGLIDDTM